MKNKYRILRLPALVMILLLDRPRYRFEISKEYDITYKHLTDIIYKLEDNRIIEKEKSLEKKKTRIYYKLTEKGRDIALSLYAMAKDLNLLR